MKKSGLLRFNLILSLLVIILFSISGFRDTGKLTMVNDIVIRNSEGALYIKGEVIVKFKEPIFTYTDKSFGISQLDNTLAQYNVSKISQRYPYKPNFKKWTIGDDDLAKVYTVKFDGAIDPDELSKQLMSSNPGILEYACTDPVYVADFIPNDPNVSAQYHISRINAYQGWDINKGDTNVVIGIVDSGSDLDHPDLQANIKRNWAEIPGNGIDDDANGYVDDWIGWDFAGAGSGQDNDPQVYGPNCDHGSHVSGCASQVTNNGVHGAGVGYKVKLLISKHGNDNDYSGAGGTSYIYYSDLGITYVYQNGVKVINCSFGSSAYNSNTQNIINNAWNAGAMLCGSAGNDGVEVPRYPAAYTNAISVAATGSTDIKASFSNYHSTVDICAPGEGILSTLWNNTYAVLDGTSMSSPIAAGHVALIRSKYPSWTPAQILERVLLGVDSIYSIPQNSAYVGKLGTGRISTFKALSDLPIFTIVSVQHNDSLYGNNDKVYDAGEVIPVAMTFKNRWVAGNNVSLRLTTTDPNVEIVQDSVFVGSIAAYGQYSTSFSNTFKVRAKSTCPFDRDITFKLDYSGTAYTDNSANTFVITFRKGFVTHNVNNLKLSLTKDGAVGKKAQSYGNGLFIGTGTVNQMYEGGLMIGINANQVSDVCRRGEAPANVSDTDFVGLQGYSLTTPGILSGQDGKGKFNDNGAGTSKIGVEVSAESYAWNTAPDQDYVIVKYIVKNTNATAVSNMFVGLYTYYQPDGQIFGNNTSVDTANRFGFTYADASPTAYYGTAILTTQTLNFRALNATDILTGFSSQEKWDALSGGVSVPTLGPGGNGMCISAGPISLPAGGTTKVAFAIMKAADLNALRTLSGTARAKYQTVGINSVSELIPTKYELSQNYPNPFNPSTNIKFALPKKDFVKIIIYDMVGRQVASLVNEELNAGYYEYKFDGSTLSSGMYFYRIQSGNYADTKKMMLVK